MNSGLSEHLPITADEFASHMDPLGPFEPRARLAAAVSGGADSMALALLADAWARQRNGSLLALVVDHGLRLESAAEAALTVHRLAAERIPTQLLCLADLPHGPALAERARAARYAALSAACADAGILHLLLGHHAADQAETVLMRRRSSSGPAGLAAMAVVTEQYGPRLVRPLLGTPPVRLRATLRAAGIAWVEDPSNQDQRALRAQLRAGLGDSDGTGPDTAALCDTAREAGQTRAARDARLSAILVERAALYPEGYALLSPGPVDQAALAALLQAVSGAPFPPPSQATAALAAALRPTTLAGVRVMPAGRLGDGWLLVREPAAVEAPIPARAGGLWDGRFRFTARATPPPAATIGALGIDAARLRRDSPLPSAVLQTLPALRCGNSLVAVPLLGYPDLTICAALTLTFSPRRPVAGAPFLPAVVAGRVIVR
jgi:tRNA(Ile)-lysidine synthase